MRDIEKSIERSKNTIIPIPYGIHTHNTDVDSEKKRYYYQDELMVFDHFSRRDTV